MVNRQHPYLQGLEKLSFIWEADLSLFPSVAKEYKVIIIIFKLLYVLWLLRERSVSQVKHFYHGGGEEDWLIACLLHYNGKHYYYYFCLRGYLSFNLNDHPNSRWDKITGEKYLIIRDKIIYKTVSINSSLVPRGSQFRNNSEENRSKQSLEKMLL